MANFIFINQKDRDYRIEQFKSLYMEPKSGFGINTALSLLLILISLVYLTIGIFAFKIFKLQLDISSIMYGVVLMILTFATEYFFAGRNDKYLKYFDKFDRWEKSKRSRNILFSILVYPIVIFLLFYGFKL